MDWSALENDLQSFGSDYQVEFKVVGGVVVRWDGVGLEKFPYKKNS